MDHVEEINVDHSSLWHPSFMLKVDRCCTAFPGGLVFTGIKPVQSVYLNNHLFVGGLYSGSEREKCRLFEYSVLLNTWDIFDINLADFCLATYQSKLLLIGGRECKFDLNGFCSANKSATKKVWILNDQYQLQEADIPPMNKARKSALAASHQNYLIIVGGDDSKYSTVEIYDGEKRKWSFAPSLPETSQLQSIVVHPNGNLYIQLSHIMSSRVFWATLQSLSGSCTPNIQESNAESMSFWRDLEIPDSESLDTVFSNLILCHGNLLILGGSHQHDKKYVFVYQPSVSDPKQRWIDIADIPVDLDKYTTGMAHIISLPDDQLLLFGHGGTWTEVMFLISFHVSAVELNCLFTLRDLEKLELANLPVCQKLKPFAFDIKTKLGLGNLTKEETLFHRIHHGNSDSIRTFIIRWIESRNPDIEHTWQSLILFLEEFGEKKIANELKHYLTCAPGYAISNETSMEELTTKKLGSIKQDIEQLCSQDLLKDADIQIHQQLQECVKLCDSAKTMLTEDYQKFEAKHEELLKEKEELNTHQLELLKQTKVHK